MKKVFIFLIFSLILTTIFSNSFFTVSSKNEKIIDVFNNCRIIQNNLNLDIFVPTKTSSEWTYFLNFKPSNVLDSECWKYINITHSSRIYRWGYDTYSCMGSRHKFNQYEEAGFENILERIDDYIVKKKGLGERWEVVNIVSTCNRDYNGRWSYYNYDTHCGTCYDTNKGNDGSIYKSKVEYRYIE